MKEFKDAIALLEYIKEKEYKLSNDDYTQINSTSRKLKIDIILVNKSRRIKKYEFHTDTPPILIEIDSANNSHNYYPITKI